MSDDSWRSIWCAGLSSLSHSSNQTNQKDQIDEMNQPSAMHREMFEGKT